MWPLRLLHYAHAGGGRNAYGAQYVQPACCPLRHLQLDLHSAGHLPPISGQKHHQPNGCPQKTRPEARSTRQDGHWGRPILRSPAEAKLGEQQ